MTLKGLRNRLQKLIRPKNVRNLRWEVGRGKCRTACTLLSSGRISLSLTWCPRKVSSFSPNTPFSGFLMTPHSSKVVENWAQMLLVFLSTRAGHEDIVNIGVCKGEATKHLVNKALEHLHSGVKTKWHFQILEKSKGGCYRRLRDIRWLNRNLIVCSNHV